CYGLVWPNRHFLTSFHLFFTCVLVSYKCVPNSFSFTSFSFALTFTALTHILALLVLAPVGSSFITKGLFLDNRNLTLHSSLPISLLVGKHSRCNKCLPKSDN
ncbi:Uncharacterized protein APZ42_004044, partial [Daphnia magna]